MHSDLLAQRVKERRSELGLSQEEVADRGGPSTTTLSKIEAGVETRWRRRTLADLDHALGWRVGSSEEVLWMRVEPRVVAAPPPSTLTLRKGPAIEPPEPPGGAPEDFWLTSRGVTDTDGNHVVVGTMASTDAEGVRTMLEVRYWPGSGSRSVSMPSFTGAVVEAHRLALDATNIYRQPKETADAQPDPAPSTRAGGSPAPDVSVEDYTLAASDDEDAAREFESHEDQP